MAPVERLSIDSNYTEAGAPSRGRYREGATKCSRLLPAQIGRRYLKLIADRAIALCIAEQVFVSQKPFADDTPIPVLDPGSGRTKTGRLWSMLGMIGPGRVMIRRQRFISTAQIARPNVPFPKWPGSAASYRLTDLPASIGSAKAVPYC
jgi:hypothetical protein